MLWILKADFGTKIKDLLSSEWIWKETKIKTQRNDRTMSTRVEKELSSHLILPPLTWFSGGHSSIENDNIFFQNCVFYFRGDTISLYHFEESELKSWLAPGSWSIHSLPARWRSFLFPFHDLLSPWNFLLKKSLLTSKCMTVLWRWVMIWPLY